MTIDDKWRALPNWCSARQACEFLGVSKATLITLIDDGAIAAWRTSPTGNWHISKDSLAKVCGLDRLLEGDGDHEEP